MRKKTPPPFSLRLTFEEAAALKLAAGDQPLGSFIRQKALEGLAVKPRKKMRRPVKDQKEMARLMGLLGQSRIASNINQLAKAANSGSLLVSHETEAAIIQACRDIAFVRQVTLRAMGIYEAGDT